MPSKPRKDRSEIAFHISEGKNLMQVLQEVEIVQVNREQHYGAYVSATS
jgi:hypothetical protein